MPRLEGSASVEIDAPIERVFAIAADIERAPEWQGTMQTASVRERDGDGRASLVETVADAKVAQLTVLLRFAYDEPRGLTWERVRGDLKALRGSWAFEDLGGRTRATYALDGDPGFVLSQALRGPVVDQVRRAMIGRPPVGLKRVAEGG
jgi:uncharacterized protein YndB with AHSA1/START domain